MTVESAVRRKRRTALNQRAARRLLAANAAAWLNGRGANDATGADGYGHDSGAAMVAASERGAREAVTGRVHTKPPDPKQFARGVRYARGRTETFPASAPWKYRARGVD